MVNETQTMSYMQLLRANLVNVQAVEDFKDNWKIRVNKHDASGCLMESRSLAEYLGMTIEEYNNWVALGPRYLTELKHKET